MASRRQWSSVEGLLGVVCQTPPGLSCSEGTGGNSCELDTCVGHWQLSAVCSRARWCAAQRAWCQSAHRKGVQSLQGQGYQMRLDCSVCAVGWERWWKGELSWLEMHPLVFSEPSVLRRLHTMQWWVKAEGETSVA
eukprot:6489298-Amphidinium_carterae.1